MDIKTFCKKFMIWTAVIVAVISILCFMFFGKIVEANLTEEVGKWIVMTLVIIGICEVLAYTLSQFVYHGSRWDPTSEKYKKLHEKK